MKGAALRRAATVVERGALLPAVERGALVRTHLANERGAFASIAAFATPPDSTRRDADAFFRQLEALFAPIAAPAPAMGDAALVFSRTAGVTGPMSLFVGYDYFQDHYTGPLPRLMEYQGLRGGGGEYTYETLNLVNGKRTAQEIRDMVSAEYGPVPIDIVVEYLRALQAAGVVSLAR